MALHSRRRANMALLLTVAVAAFFIVQAGGHVDENEKLGEVPEKKMADDKQSVECTKTKSECAWDKLKYYTYWPFQKLSFPSMEKTGGAVKDAAAKSYESGKKTAEMAGEKIKHTASFGSNPPQEEL